MVKLLKFMFIVYMQKLERKRLQVNISSEGNGELPNLSMAGIILLFSSSDYIPVESFKKISKILGH